MQQEAGDHSKQIQMKNCNCILVKGIDEKRVREICDEKNLALIKELTEEARSIAEQRIKIFEDALISRIRCLENSLEAFIEPAFQFVLKEAQKTAAKSDRSADYALLSELLIQRIENGANRKRRIGIDKAVEIVADISDEALMCLTISTFIKCYYPISESILEGLNILNNIFQALMYDTLPNDLEWEEELNILGAIRTSVIPLQTAKYEKFFFEKMTGYCSVGIKKDSEAHLKALEMLDTVQLPSASLCDHELNIGYVRLAIPNEEMIRYLHVKYNNPIVYRPLTELQQKICRDIWSMYEKNSTLEENIFENLCHEIEKRAYLNKARIWWNNHQIPHQITSIGTALAYANGKRVYPFLPSLGTV